MSAAGAPPATPAQTERPTWVRGAIVLAIRQYVSDHQRVPTTADLDPSIARSRGEHERVERFQSGRYPRLSSIRSGFEGGLPQVLYLAGLPQNKSGRRPRDYVFVPVDLADYPLSDEGQELFERIAADEARVRGDAQPAAHEDGERDDEATSRAQPAATDGDQGSEDEDAPASNDDAPAAPADSQMSTPAKVTGPLAPDTAEVLAYLAVAGDGCHPKTIARLTKLRVERVVDALEDLHHRGLAETWSWAPTGAGRAAYARRGA